MSKIVIKTQPRTVVDTYEIEAITDHMTYIFKDFLALRGNRPKDATEFAKCPVCQSRHRPDDKVYSAFNVKKNGKHIGNKFACEDCFTKYKESTDD